MPSTSSTSSRLDVQMVRPGTRAAARAWRRRCSGGSRCRAGAASAASRTAAPGPRPPPRSRCRCRAGPGRSRRPCTRSPGTGGRRSCRISCSSRTKRGWSPGRRTKRSSLPGRSTRPTSGSPFAAVELEHHADAAVGDEREGVGRDRRRSGSAPRSPRRRSAGAAVEVVRASARRPRARRRRVRAAAPVSSCQQRCWTRDQLGDPLR